MWALHKRAQELCDRSCPAEGQGVRGGISWHMGPAKGPISCGKPCRRASPAEGLWQALCRRAKRFPSKDGEQDVDEFSSIDSGKPFPELPELDLSHETEEPLPE